MSALIFDCDGVLADTEQYGHLPAFNRMFKEFGLPVCWSEAEYGEKIKIAGGKERISSLLTPEFIERADLPQDPETLKMLVARWHQRKTEIYRQMVMEGLLPGRPGVRRVVLEAIQAGWKLAVASTSAEESVRSVLNYTLGKDLAEAFVVLAGDVVPRKKPAPDIYLLALQKLGVTANEALVVEDSRIGLLAAVAAGIRCVVTFSSYTSDEDMHEAALVVSNLGEPDESMQVLSNHSRANPQGYVKLADLQACLA
ncbi:MAG: HAD-IA family hydrolase [Anaerolineae bacterium]|nr:HAD-IA family hydrolase [Anaerolineae bacterium]